MNAVSTLCMDVWQQAQALDKLCNGISPGLLFFDAFEPKIPDANMDAEKEFWYAVVNLYGLLVDCAPYVWRRHDQFFRNRYLPLDNTPRRLVDILVAHNCMTEDERYTIQNYAEAISHLRHCFCHNMPVCEFNRFTIKNGLGEIAGDWCMFPYLDKYNHKPMDYTVALGLLRNKTMNLFAIVRPAITRLSQKMTDEILDDWSRCIITWYLQSDEVLNRAMHSYYYSGKRELKKGQQVKQWRQNLFANVKARSAARGMTWQDFINDWVEELTINASCSHSKATAELILPDFFDDVLF